MATSSVTKNFVVSGCTQVRKFAQALEDSCQESLHRPDESKVGAAYTDNYDDVMKILRKRKNFQIKSPTGLRLKTY